MSPKSEGGAARKYVAGFGLTELGTRLGETGVFF